MPKGNTIVMPGSKLLFIGTEQGIRKAKRIVGRIKKPEELKFV